MRSFLFVILALIVLFSACGEDVILEEIESEKEISVVSVDEASENLLAPVLEKEVVTLYVAPDSWQKDLDHDLPDDVDVPKVTTQGKINNIYLLTGGLLTIERVFFPEAYYHLIWCYLDEDRVLVHVLANKILYVTDAEDFEQIEERQEEVQRLRVKIAAQVHDAMKKRGVGMRQEMIDEHINKLLYREMSLRPFFSVDGLGLPAGKDLIEVEINHRMQYGSQEILFVRVLRNLSRPRIEIPQPRFL